MSEFNWDKAKPNVEAIKALLAERDGLRVSLEEAKKQRDGYHCKFLDVKKELDELKAELERLKDDYTNVFAECVSRGDQADSLRLLAESYRVKLSKLCAYIDREGPPAKEWEEITRLVEEARKALEEK